MRVSSCGERGSAAGRAPRGAVPVADLTATARRPIVGPGTLTETPRRHAMARPGRPADGLRSRHRAK